MKKERVFSEEEFNQVQARLKDAHAEIARLSGSEETSVFPNLRISFDGKLLSANGAAHQMMVEWGCQVNKEIPEEVYKTIPHLFTSNKSFFAKIPFLHFTVCFHVVPVRELGYINFFGTDVDYSHTRQSEEAETLYKLLIENSQAILIRWRNENPCPVEFVSANISQFGYNAEEFISRKILYTDVIHPLDLVRVMNEVKENEKKHILKYQQEYRVVTKTGDIRWIEDRTAVDEKDPNFHQAVLIDITERKKAETLLKNSLTELKKLNSELDRFVYSASHDLKAPLRSIMGLINLAKSDAASGGQDIYMDKIFRSANKLDSFINDLINFTRNTRLNVELKEINFENLIAETMENLKYMEHAERIEINTEINDVPFYSDENRLSILFSNMISNAIKYQNLESDAQAELNIFIRISKTQAVIEFSDNGSGIDKENLGSIFKMFYRASSQSEGSGLGLYIVKEILKKLGGKIKVDSKLGKGTNFTIHLPNKFSE